MGSICILENQTTRNSRSYICISRNPKMSSETKPEIVSCTFDSHNHDHDHDHANDEKPTQCGHGEKADECKRHEVTIPPCPKCGKNNDVVKIMFGMPTPELAKHAEDGKIVLGGCCPPKPGEVSRNYR